MKYLVLLLFLVLIVFTGCSDKRNREEDLIMEAVQLKQDLYRKELTQECIKSMQLMADQIADSIVLDIVDVRNSLEKPDRPLRPEVPEINYIDTILLEKPGKIDSAKEEVLK
jgi:hypothetical protein